MGENSEFRKVEFAPGLFGYEIGDRSAPGIVAIQEWWGVNDTIKDHASYLSKELDARCLIPDLYKGKVGVTVEEAEHSMANLDFPAAVKELAGVVPSFRALPWDHAPPRLAWRRIESQGLACGLKLPNRSLDFIQLLPPT